MKAEETFRLAEWFVVKLTLLILLVAGAVKLIAPEIVAVAKLFRP